MLFVHLACAVYLLILQELVPLLSCAALLSDTVTTQTSSSQQQQQQSHKQLKGRLFLQQDTCVRTGLSVHVSAPLFMTSAQFKQSVICSADVSQSSESTSLNTASTIEWNSRIVQALMQEVMPLHMMDVRAAVQVSP